MTDLKGFDWLGRSWSWPEWDVATDLVHRPAHALGDPGRTACGLEWPHQFERACGTFRTPAPNDPPDVGWLRPRMAPERKNLERLKADVEAHLCLDCLAVVRPAP